MILLRLMKKFNVFKKIYKLFNQKKLNQELIEAIQYNNFKRIKYLIDYGADIHAYDDALSLSASHGHLEVVKYLVENDADIHASNDEALMVSANNGYLEVVKYFLFDCNMQIKQDTKDWLIKNHQEKTLNLIEKRDLLFKLDKDIIQKDSVDNLGKKVKI